MPGWINNDRRPLMQQWEELRGRGAFGVTPVSQEALQAMRLEIEERERKNPPVRDEALVAAWREFTDVVHRYRRVWNEITEAQKALGRHRTDPIYTLMFDMRDVLQPVTPPQDWLDSAFGGKKAGEDLYRLRLPEFGSVEEYRRATNWASDCVFKLTTKQTSVAAVSRWHATEPASRVNQIAAALLKHIDTIERATVRHLNAFAERLDQIEAQSERIAKSAKFIRGQKQKAAKQRSK